MKKPEMILLVPFFLNLLFLFFSASYYFHINVILFMQLILPLYTIIVICLVFQILSQRGGFFLISVVFHLLALLILFRSAGYMNPILNVIHIFFLLLTISLKLTATKAISIELLILVMLTSSLNQFARGEIVHSFFFFFTGSLFIAFTQLVTYYREELIKSRIGEEEKTLSIDKLETVSESLLQHLAEIREESAEEERYRITRELHDSLGYSMTNIVMIMNAAQYLMEDDPEKVKDYCIKTRDMATATMEETRDTLYKLREITRDIPKNPAFFFDKMCRDFEEATGIITHCEGGNFSSPVSDRIFSTVYRIVQVGFINALKHGGTKFIRLFFWVDENELRMTVWNNINKPVDSSRFEEGIGLKGVRERLKVLEGELTIEQIGKGFSLNISIPLGIDDSCL